MQKVKTYTLYNDPGHAWLKVPYADLVKLGIERAISPYSYMYGQSAYLEEDRDLSLFIIAMRKTGKEIKIKDVYTSKDSKIRSYRNYNSEQFNTMPSGIAL